MCGYTSMFFFHFSEINNYCDFFPGQHGPSKIGSALNPIALRTAKTPKSLGCSECNRVKKMNKLKRGKLIY